MTRDLLTRASRYAAQHPHQHQHPLRRERGAATLFATATLLLSTVLGGLALGQREARAAAGAASFLLDSLAGPVPAVGVAASDTAAYADVASIPSLAPALARSVTATPVGDGEATVAWTPATVTAGTPAAQAFWVQIYQADGTYIGEQVAPATDRTARVVGLVPGTSYLFGVLAESAGSFSPYRFSPQVTARGYRGAPGIPVPPPAIPTGSAATVVTPAVSLTGARPLCVQPVTGQSAACTDAVTGALASIAAPVPVPVPVPQPLTTASAIASAAPPVPPVSSVSPSVPGTTAPVVTPPSVAVPTAPAAAPVLGREAWQSYTQTNAGSAQALGVNVANGNLVVTAQDSTTVQAHGQLAYSLRRSYNSMDTTPYGPGGIGQGWRLNLGEELADSSAAGVLGSALQVPQGGQPTTGAVTLIDRDGTHHTFTAKPLPQALTVSSPQNGDNGVCIGLLSPTCNPFYDGSRFVDYVRAHKDTLLCVDATYAAPAGVHLGLYRYVEVPYGGSFACPADPSSISGSVVLGYAAVRPDRLRTEFASTGELLSMTDRAGVELRYVYDVEVAPGVALGRLRYVYEPPVLLLRAGQRHRPGVAPRGLPRLPDQLRHRRHLGHRPRPGRARDPLRPVDRHRAAAAADPGHQP